MELYDKVKTKLGEVNTVKTVNHCYFRLDYHRWSIDKVKPQNATDIIEEYKLVSRVCEIPHKFSMFGSVLVITRIDPTDL